MMTVNMEEAVQINDITLLSTQVYTTQCANDI